MINAMTIMPGIRNCFGSCIELTILLKIQKATQQGARHLSTYPAAIH
jgi:hypothetical protein